MKSYKISMRKIENFQSISNVFEQYQQQIGKSKGIKDCFEKLNSNISKLRKLQALAAKDVSLIEDNKNKCRTLLIEKVMPIVTILKIYAFDHQKNKLTKKLEKFTPDELAKFTDVEVTNAVQDIWKLINKYGGYSCTFEDKLKIKKVATNVKVVNKLDKFYGLSPNSLKGLEESFIAYTNAFYTYENELSEKIKVIKKIKSNLENTESLIEHKLDLYVSLFQIKFPEFYQAYHVLRLTDKKHKNQTNHPHEHSSEE